MIKREVDRVTEKKLNKSGAKCDSDEFQGKSTHLLQTSGGHFE